MVVKCNNTQTQVTFLIFPPRHLFHIDAFIHALLFYVPVSKSWLSGVILTWLVCNAVHWYLDSKFLANSIVLEEPFFNTLICVKDDLQSVSVNLPDFFQTDKAHCHIYPFGENVCSQSKLLLFVLHFLFHPVDPNSHVNMLGSCYHGLWR